MRLNLTAAASSRFPTFRDQQDPFLGCPGKFCSCPGPHQDAISLQRSVPG